MKSILRATAILSGTSLVTIIVGLVTAKAWAILIGPNGLGYMGLLQSLVGLIGLIAGMGVGTGLVRAGAKALAQQNSREIDALRRAGWLLFWLLGTLAVILMIIFRVPISQWMLGGEEHSSAVILMSLTLLFTMATGLQGSLLNAYHKVEALAKIGVLNSIFSVIVSLLLVWSLGEAGIPLAVVASAFVQWGLSFYFTRRGLAQPVERAEWPEVLVAMRGLLRFGAPYTASILVGTGVQMALPVLVLHSLGTQSVGFYRAAATVSVTYLGFLLTAMAQDYYPRISAVSDDAAAMAKLVNQQFRLVMLLAMPMILATLALAPYLVPLVYSNQFTPAVDVLEWQLIGDIFKFSSWTMSFVVLVRCGGALYFGTELIAGVTTLASSWLAMQWFGLAGLGIGFLITYIVYYAVVWFVAHREIELTLSQENKRLFFMAIIATAFVTVLPFVGLSYLKTPAALILSLIIGLISISVLWREIRGMTNVATI